MLRVLLELLMRVGLAESWRHYARSGRDAMARRALPGGAPALALAALCLALRGALVGGDYV